MRNRSVLVASAAAVFGAVVAAAALGGGGVAGDLGAGGTARGDVSLAAGDEDYVSIDLVRGARLDATLSAGFGAQVELLSPTDAPTGAAFAANGKLVAWTAQETGRHRFRIRSADGSQGLYTLTAKTKVGARVTATGAVGGPVRVALPANAAVTATVAATPAKSWDPGIDWFGATAGANLLAAPVAGAKGKAVLKKTVVPELGEYELAVAGAPGATFSATFAVKPPKAKPAKLDLRDGLTPVSFAQDGVAALMTKHNCVSCHAWATSYAGVKGHAALSSARMQSGQMPQGGAKVPSAELALFKSWIAGGMNP